MDYQRRAAAVEAAASERRHHGRRGATPDRRYSSSSDEGEKVAKDRVPNSNARRKASGGGGGERWTSRNAALTSSNPHFTQPGSIGGSQNLTSEMSNGSLHNRLYSYLSGSEDEAVDSRIGLSSHRPEFGLQRRNSTSSPVDVSSPSWVRSPSETCDSESEQDGMVPPHLGDHATSVDGTSRFGENIYSRIKMDSAVLPMPAIPPPPPETSFGPAVPPRRIPTSVKHQVNSTGIETASSGQRGPRGPEESYFELNGPMAYASSGNVLYDPTDRLGVSPNIPVPTFPRTVPCGAVPGGIGANTTQQQRHLMSRSSVTETVPVNAPVLSTPLVIDGTDPLSRSPTAGTVPLWRRQDRVAGELATSASAERQNSTFNPNAVMLTSTNNATLACPVQSNFRHYSHFGQRVQKQLHNRCTWKCAAVFFIALTVIFLFLISYFVAMKLHNLSWNLEKIPLSDFNNSSQSVGPIYHYSPSVISITMGKQHEAHMSPHSFLRTQLYLPEGKFVKFNFSYPASSLIGIYSARNVHPSHARYDFFEILDGRKPVSSRRGQRSLRSLDAMVSSGFVNYMEDGLWYVSVYNDGDRPLSISFVVTLQEPSSASTCPRGCHGRGDCIDGQCHCFTGYTGWDCKQSVCPVLCNNNGIYLGGECKCYPSWKGKECDIPSSQCEDPSCTGNGKCVGGMCVCAPGYKGIHCQEVDCLSPNCSGNGICIAGAQCRCFSGYWGSDCSLPLRFSNTTLCVRDCSGHGTFAFPSQSCLCQSGWTGADCEIEICNVDCVHGWCEKQRCVCEKGWSGTTCDRIECDPRCAKHGFCDNGTCTCKPGWNGRHCSLDGCPKSCNNHGTCQSFHGTWKCSCRDGWKGSACDVAMEVECNGNMDEDRDGLTDCFDPDCCMSISCKDSEQCLTAPDPMEILLRKQPTSNSAPFFEQIRFLIEDDSVQSYATLSSFNQSQVSVIRGKAISKDGSPLIGVRVTVVTQPLYGYTLTRDLGLFDILVNGGGSVTLNFQRHPFKLKQMTVMVPWNRMVTMETVMLILEDEEEPAEEACPQGTHDHYWMHPVVLSTWKHTQLAACPSKSTIIPESQVLQESLRIPGTGIYLVYHSSQTPGYMSTILIQLTPSTIPANLSVIHVRILVEGLVYERVFEADPNLKYNFAWDRRNAYNQKVYGIVTASVGVGYQYEGCSKLFWEMQSATMSSYDVTVTEVGGWRLHVHHTYNFQEGILHKGDGTNIYLKEQPWKALTILGDGKQRKVDCRSCDGRSEDARLMAPVALASGRDGSLYIGDYNLIRKLAANRDELNSILQLSMPEVPYKYFMTVSPVDGKLYISDHQSLRILRVKTMGAVRDLAHNFEVIAGTGEQCVPGEKEMCGDNGPAVSAKLNYPKGVAIDKDGLIYFADGANIRIIDESGIIRTLIGSQGHPKYWQPLACHRVISVDEVTLHWPTSLAINPLDNAVHILDNNMVLKVTDDNMVLVVAGRPLHCPPRNANRGLLHDDEQAGQSLATDTLLIHPQHISFAPNGDLYIVESNGREVNQVRLVDTDGKIRHYAGAKSTCDCRRDDCECFLPNEQLSTKMLLNNPTAITITPDYIVHIADMGNLRIHSVFPPLPIPDKQGQYDVMYPQMQEMYIFNRFGHHIATKNIVTGQYVYNFTYTVNSYYGKLVQIMDSSKNALTIRRDYKLQATELLPPGGQKCKFLMNSLGQLQTFVDSDNSTTWFTYISNTGLMDSKETSQGQRFIYDFDNNGRLSKVIQPTGERAVLNHYGTYSQMKNISYPHNSYLVIEYPFKMAVTLETSPHPLLSMQLPLTLKRRIILPDNLTNTVEWRYTSPGDGNEMLWGRREDQAGRGGMGLPTPSKVYASPSRGDLRTRLGDGRQSSEGINSNSQGYEGKTLLVNGENVLTFKFFREEMTQVILNHKSEEMLAIKYDASGRPIQVVPRGPIESLNVTYDWQSRMTQWSFGNMNVTRTYDNKSNHLVERKLSNKAIYRYLYKNSNKPTDVILPSGKQFQFHHDEHGNLKSIVMPNLSKHHLYSLTTIGVHRLLYRPPESHGLYIQDFNSAGKLVQVSYPSSHRRLTYYYSQSGRPVRIFSDWMVTAYSYYNDTELLHSINVTNVFKLSESFCALIFEPRSSLITKHLVLFEGQNGGFVSSQFHYTYDRNFRIESTQAEVGDRSLRAVLHSYHPETGRLQKLGPFTFEYVHAQREITRDGNVEIIREFDRLGRATDVWYRFNVDHTVFNLDIKYDSMGRLHQWIRKIKSSDTKAYDYTYDIDGNLVEVLENSQSTWKYEYDTNANIVKISHYGNVRRSVVGKNDRVESSGQESYIYDQDGFLVLRNHEMFEYDSFGQLYRAFQTGQYDIRYCYDGLRRLVGRQDKMADRLVQFFYGDLQKKNHITHIYDHQIKKVTRFFYDDRDKLFAMQSESDFFYIGLDPNDSPILVINSVGSIVKQISYDPLGNPISDSAPDFTFPLGFRSSFMDNVTKLVFLERVVYDPQLGRRMVPDYDEFLSGTNQLPWNPETANLYRFNFLKQSTVLESEVSISDLSSWLMRVGFNYNSLVPRVNFHGEVRPKSDRQMHIGQLMPVTSAFHCAFDRDMENFLELSVVPSLSVTGVTSDLDIGQSFVPMRSLFGPGIILSIDENRVSVNVLDSANEIMVLLATTLLNNSLAVGLRYTIHGHDVHHFVKPSVDQAVDDIKGLSLRAEGIIQGLNVTVQQIPQASDNTVQFIDIRLHSNYTLLNLRYGTTLKAERDRVLRHAKQRAVQGAWEIERELTQSQKLRINTWTKRQEEELLSKKHVDGIIGEYALDVSEYPELADCPKIIKFIPAVR